jgi:hypothetical protein
LHALLGGAHACATSRGVVLHCPMCRRPGIASGHLPTACWPCAHIFNPPVLVARDRVRSSPHSLLAVRADLYPACVGGCAILDHVRRTGGGHVFLTRPVAALNSACRRGCGCPKPPTARHPSGRPSRSRLHGSPLHCSSSTKSSRSWPTSMAARGLATRATPPPPRPVRLGYARHCAPSLTRSLKRPPVFL